MFAFVLYMHCRVILKSVISRIGCIMPSICGWWYWSVCSIIPMCYFSTGDGVTKPFFPFPYFPIFVGSSNDRLPIQYHVHICQMSPQLSCGDTWQIWMWIEESKLYVCSIKISRNGVTDHDQLRSFSDPHSSTLHLTHAGLVSPHDVIELD